MVRRRRHDAPGRLHHVVNRGQNRARIFRYRSDYRYFLALLVCAVRAGRIRVHAYSLMPNHFHLLVESVDGDISGTMRWLQGRYGAYFNRTGKNCGHVFGGRFHSFPVTSAAYAFVCIRYIDRNCLVAREGEDPLRFSWGSARHHARPGPRPRWLDRHLVDRFLCARLRGDSPRPEAYRAVFALRAPDGGTTALVEGRLSGRMRALDSLDHLLAAGHEAVMALLIDRAGHGAQPSPRLPMIDAGSIRTAVEHARATVPIPTQTNLPGRGRDPWLILQTGLLRDLAGLTLRATARGIEKSLSRTAERYTLHARLVGEDAAYRRWAASVAQAALECGFGQELRKALPDVRASGPWWSTTKPEESA